MFLYYLPGLIYLALIVFVIWFMVKIIKTQQEKNRLLKRIADSLDKQDN